MAILLKEPPFPTPSFWCPPATDYLDLCRWSTRAWSAQAHCPTCQWSGPTWIMKHPWKPLALTEWYVFFFWWNDVMWVNELCLRRYDGIMTSWFDVLMIWWDDDMIWWYDDMKTSWYTMIGLIWLICLIWLIWLTWYSDFVPCFFQIPLLCCLKIPWRS